MSRNAEGARNYAETPDPGAGTELTRQAKWQAANPIKRWAHLATASAVRKGIIKKQACEVCGAVENVDAHHPDYHRPLAVRWLCRRHHVAEHKKAGGER